MKARVIATGRIIEVICVMNIEGMAVWEDISGISTTPNQYTSDELEFLDLPEMPIATYTPDYWTRFEHQTAIAAMQGMLTNPIGFENIRAGGGNLPIETALLASEYAHALVEKMKEER